jgi:hypothetical protein
MTWTHLTLKSANAKTGPIPVSTTEPDSCPPSCPFRDAGCYAKSGPLALHWRKLAERERGMPWGEFCIAIASLPAGQLWRLNQAGDLPGRGEEVNLSELRQLLRANKGKRGFSYSHKRSAEALAAIREANAEGLTVNLSGNSLADADALAETGAGPVVCVLPATQTTNTRTPAGRKVVICPATQREGVSCATCQLCARGARSVIVGFPAHGTGAKRASAIAGGVS